MSRQTVARKPFNRDSMARSYAKRHLKTDPGIREIYYLPADAPELEIRLVEVNELIAERENDRLEPIDFGVDIEGSTGHTLIVLDVTPVQWQRISSNKLPLPDGWSLEGAKHFVRN